MGGGGAAHRVPSQPAAPGTRSSLPPSRRGYAGAGVPRPQVMGFTSPVSPGFIAALLAATAAMVGNAALLRAFTSLDHRVGVSRGRRGAG